MRAASSLEVPFPVPFRHRTRPNRRLECLNDVDSDEGGLFDSDDDEDFEQGGEENGDMENDQEENNQEEMIRRKLDVEKMKMMMLLRLINQGEYWKLAFQVCS